VNKCLLALILCSLMVWARPEMEYSEDGMYWRIHNPDKRAYYCFIILGDGSEYEKIIYPGMYTRWYPLRGGYEWECES